MGNGDMVKEEEEIHDFILQSIIIDGSGDLNL